MFFFLYLSYFLSGWCLTSSHFQCHHSFHGLIHFTRKQWVYRFETVDIASCLRWKWFFFLCSFFIINIYNWNPILFRLDYHDLICVIVQILFFILAYLWLKNVQHQIIWSQEKWEKKYETRVFVWWVMYGMVYKMPIKIETLSIFAFGWIQNLCM